MLSPWRLCCLICINNPETELGECWGVNDKFGWPPRITSLIVVGKKINPESIDIGINFIKHVSSVQIIIRNLLIWGMLCFVWSSSLFNIFVAKSKYIFISLTFAYQTHVTHCAEGSGSPSVHVMAICLFDTKPSHAPMVVYCQLDP